VKLLKTIERVAIHQSASTYGTSSVLRRWHRERGWSDIGYHRLILNGHRGYGTTYEPDLDGMTQEGRDLIYQGAHVKGWNEHTLAICLIGDGDGLPVGIGYISPNMWASLLYLCMKWHRGYGVPFTHFVGHREFPGVSKTCPGFDVAQLRSALEAEALKGIECGYAQEV